MISGVREREIIQCACDTVKDAGFESLPVDPKTIASSFGITVFPWNAGKLGISGFLMKAGNKFGLGIRRPSEMRVSSILQLRMSWGITS